MRLETQFADARRQEGPLYKVKKANVVVLEIPSKPLRKGDAVLTEGRFGGDPIRGTVAEIIDGGVAYKIKGDDVRDGEIDLDRIARAAK